MDDKEVSDTELQTLRQNKASEYDVVTVETDGKPAVKSETKPVSNITIRGLKGTVKSVNGTPVFPIHPIMKIGWQEKFVIRMVIRLSELVC